MARIFLFVATGLNLPKSIGSALELSEYQALLPPANYRTLQEIYPDGKVWAWALGDQHKKTWEHNFEPGRPCIFVNGRGIEYCARVTATLDSATLGRAFWGSSAEAELQGDQTHYRYLVFLTKPRSPQVAIPMFSALTGYRYTPRNPPAGSFLIPAEKCEALYEAIRPYLESAPVFGKDSGEQLQGAILQQMLGELARVPPVTNFGDAVATESSTANAPSDPWEAIKKRDRRNRTHQDLVKRLAAIARTKSKWIGRSKLLDLVIGDGQNDPMPDFIEVKSIDDDAGTQGSRALAQLYRYRFVYRKQYRPRSIVAAFSERPMDGHEDIAAFLATCGIDSVWIDGDGFDGTENAKARLGWLFNP